MDDHINKQMLRTTKMALLLGAFYLFLGILLGAFAAHSLKETLTGYQLGILQTGVKYQLIHGVALLALGVLYALYPRSLLNAAIISIAIGVMLFSFSLYAIALFETTYLGLITPIGGLFMMIAWVLTIYTVAKE